MIKWLFALSLFTCACSHLQAQVNYITTIAGDGTAAYTGDGGPALNAEFFYPQCICLDHFGNLYVADNQPGNRIRKIVLSTGIITTVAGTGTGGFSGDGGPATDAMVFYPQGICTDTLGNVYFGDCGNYRVRKINVSDGSISTVAGNGIMGNSGSGGLATNAELNYPTGLVIKGDDFYISDIGNNIISKITLPNGIISTIAGNGTAGYSGDGGPAIQAEFNWPSEIAIDTHGDIFITDALNNCLRKVETATNIISTICGNGSTGYSGNGGPASNAILDQPYGIFIDKKNNIYFSDDYYSVIREIVSSTGIINTVAGCGIAGFSGDDGPAISAEIQPADVCLDSVGTIYIADFLNYRIRKLYNPLGVPLTPEMKYSVYPNPANDELNIDGLAENTQYRMLSVTGACLRQGILVPGNNVLSIKNLVPGVYILELTDGEGQRNMVRVVKE
jgi:hypothetical protein